MVLASRTNMVECESDDDDDNAVHVVALAIP
jgi:hypothetical protein